MQQNEHWDRACEMCKLVDKNRLPAAKSIWCRMDEVFRRSLLEFVVDILRSPEDVATCPDVLMESTYGSYRQNPSFLKMLARTVPVVANVVRR